MDPRGRLRLRTEGDTEPSHAQATPIEHIEAATAALSSVHALLTELVDTLSAHRPPQRLSPGRLASLQRRLDQTLRAIDDIVKTTRRDGQTLLGGRWKVVSTVADRVTSFPVSSASADSLCDGRRKLSDTLSGGFFDLTRSPVEDVCGFVAKAADQVSMQQRQLATFFRSPAVVSDDAMRIAAENRAAADRAISDLDLVQATSQITRGHLLAAAQFPRRGR